MNEHLLKLHESDLRQLAAALRSGRLAPPFSGMAVQRVVSPLAATEVASDLQQLAGTGFSAVQIALVLEMLLGDRVLRPRAEELIELVTTGPEAAGVTNRDTRIVVRELFANATDSVLVAGYAVYQGQQVFRALADRMQEHPALKVLLLLDVQRHPGDTSATSEIVRRFADRFVHAQWPANRPLPAVYYDPRSLEVETAQRSCLHAKCVVVDRRTVFISSANFTEAAQDRNIEVGLLVRSPSLATQLSLHFDALLAEGHLTKAF